MMRLKPVRVI